MNLQQRRASHLRDDSTSQPEAHQAPAKWATSVPQQVQSATNASEKGIAPEMHPEPIGWYRGARKILVGRASNVKQTCDKLGVGAKDAVSVADFEKQNRVHVPRLERNHLLFERCEDANVLSHGGSRSGRARRLGFRFGRVDKALRERPEAH